jgi:acetyl esterase/lipase
MMEAASGTKESHIRIINALAYAPPEPAASQGHLLDLYLPLNSVGPMPVVIWSRGSGWRAENGRAGAEIVAAQLTNHGFAVAGVAIRSSRSAHFPAQLYDIKAAIRWLRAHAEPYQLDPDRFAIMGESSGGWAAAMAGLTSDIAHLEGDVGEQGLSSRVRAVVAFYPPTDFLQMDAHMLGQGVAFNRLLDLTDGHADPRSPESLLLGGPIQAMTEAARQANPITYVSREAPPFLLLHGRQDLLVPYHQSELLYHALRNAGAEVALVTLPNGQHGQWNGFLSEPGINAGAVIHSSQYEHQDRTQPVQLSWNTLIQFFKRHLSNSL